MFKIKKDIIVEDSDISIYEILIKIIKKMNNLDDNQIVPLSKKNLKEEMNAKKVHKDNMPVIVDILLPTIISILNK